MLQPAGACGQLDAALCPAGQVTSTTLAPAGGRWVAALKNSSGAHQTSYACGIQVVQDSPVPMASRWPGASPVAETRSLAFRSWAGVLACEMRSVSWTEATRLAAPSPATRPARTRRAPVSSSRAADTATAVAPASRTSATAVASSTLA